MRSLALYAAFAAALVACGTDDGSAGSPDASDDAAPLDSGDSIRNDAHAPANGDAASSGDAAASGDASAPDAARDATHDAAPPPSPLCTGTAAGAYCGNDGVTNGDPSTLYQCPGANRAPTSSQRCANGCQSQPPGTPDNCKSVVTPDSYSSRGLPARRCSSRKTATTRAATITSATTPTRGTSRTAAASPCTPRAAERSRT